MIVRITGISIDDSLLTMKPFLTEIPDREIGWDLGHDHMEMYVCNQDDFLDQFDPNNYAKFSFDFEHVEVHEINGEPFRWSLIDREGLTLPFLCLESEGKKASLPFYGLATDD